MELRELIARRSTGSRLLALFKSAAATVAPKKKKDDEEEEDVLKTPSVPGLHGAVVKHPITRKPLTSRQIAAILYKQRMRDQQTAAASGKPGAAKPGQPSLAVPAAAAASQGDRKDVQHPGSRGGKWYRIPKGEIRYGTPPSGEQGHEVLDQLGSEHFQKDQTVHFETKGGAKSGKVANANTSGLVLDTEKGRVHIPYNLVKRTENPPQEGARQVLTHQHMKVGQGIHFQHQGAEKVGKVVKWGAQGALVMDKAGHEYKVPYGDMSGLHEPEKETKDADAKEGSGKQEGGQRAAQGGQDGKPDGRKGPSGDAGSHRVAPAKKRVALLGKLGKSRVVLSIC